MGEDVIRDILIGVPNFVGFTLALFLLYARLKNQDEIIQELIRRWSDCEDDRERKPAMSSD